MIMTDACAAFAVGGTICVIGQLLMDKTKLTAPRILVIFVTAGALLQALNLYQPLVDFAGTGATVPLPGFGYALAKGAIKGSKTGFLDAITGGIIQTAPGVAVAIAFGYLVALLFSPKSKR